MDPVKHAKQSDMVRTVDLAWTDAPSKSTKIQQVTLVYTPTYFKDIIK